MSTPPDWTRQPAAKPFARWTGDTEQAFLLALRLTGRAREAAAAIGRSTSAAYVRRRRDAGFAARWDAVVAEQQAAWIAEQGAVVRALGETPLGDRRLRRDGWSDVRRKLFLRALSETGSVADACKRARISSTSAYRLRDDCARFAADWQTALDTQAVTIEQAAYERAVLGWEEPILHGGQVVGHRWRYSESLLRTLVQQAGGETGKGAAAQRSGSSAYAVKPATREETNAALIKALAAAQRRILGVTREEQNREWREAFGKPLPGNEG